VDTVRLRVAAGLDTPWFGVQERLDLCAWRLLRAGARTPRISSFPDGTPPAGPYASGVAKRQPGGPVMVKRKYPLVVEGDTQAGGELSC
jgi:hypothetical protein